MKHAYLVWNAQDPEVDALRVEATDHGYAVEEWAEESENDAADYPILGGSTVVVCVRRDHPGAKVRRYEVSGEWSPSYFARPLASEAGAGADGGDRTKGTTEEACR